MTPEKVREAGFVMIAAANGKQIQAWCGGKWVDTDPNWDWSERVYRIKPSESLRPWTEDEVPLGAWKRVKGATARVMLIGSGTSSMREEWMVECEHSVDGGRTWKPCGVEEGQQ